MIRYSNDDRRRMHEEAAEQGEIHAELDRLTAKYAQLARIPTTQAEIDREQRLTRVRESLQIRPHGDDGS